MRWLGLVVILVACGDNALPIGSFVAGNRLHPSFLVAEDGTKQFVTWHDSELDTDCSWSSTDTPRCLPELPTAEVYEDGACSRPLATVGSGTCEEVPVRVTAIDHTVVVDACTDPEDVGARKIWTVAAAISADPIYLWSNGVCTPTHPTSDTTYYRTKDSIGPERLVTGRVVELGGGRIKTRTIIGDDGSIAPAGAFDSDLEATCTVSPDRMQCVPAFVASTTAEDATCSRPIGYAAQGCAPPRYIGVAHDDLRLFRTGELYTDDPTRVITVYDSSVLVAGQGWSCSQRMIHVIDGYALYHAGAPLSADALPAVVRVLGAGKRLEPYLFAVGDHREPDTSTNELHDTQLGIDCRPMEITKGTWRCLPALWFGAGMFSDAACTMPTTVIFGGDRGNGPAIVEAPVDACNSVPHLFEVGAQLPVSTQLYWVSSDGTCHMFTWDPTQERLFSAGAELPFEPYAALTRETD